MICKKCGAKIDDNIAECPFCGAVYAAEEAPETEVQEPAEEVIETPEASEPEEEPSDVLEETKVIDSDAVIAAAAAAEEEKTQLSGEEIDRLFSENEENRRRQIERLSSEKQAQLREIEQRRKTKKNKQRIIKAAVVLAAAACVGAVGVGVYNISRNKEKTPEVVLASQQPTEEPKVPAVETELPTEGAEITAAPIVEADNSAENTTGTVSGASAQTSSGGTASSSGTAKSTAGAAGSGAASTGSVSASSNKTASGTGAGSGTAAASGSGTSKSANTANTKTQQTATAASTGSSGQAKLSSALVKGIEVVTDGNKRYMSFNYNGGTYYAEVDANSTTSYVSGRYLTINGYKTNEMYNGSSVYHITNVTSYSSSSIIPKSGYALLTEADLAGKSANDLKLARNEIYARHGRQFKDQSLQAYFNSCSWYKVNPNYNYANDASNLNSIEQANATFIKKYEDSHN